MLRNRWENDEKLDKGYYMMYNELSQLYRITPSFMRKLVYLIPIEYRLGGRSFIDSYNFLKKSDRWPREKLIPYQKKQLDALLKHAVKHVPFYKNISLDPDDSFKNLKKFPIIDKEIIQRNMEKFMADNMSITNTHYVTTGGTSGNQLGFYLDNSSYGKECAFKFMAWSRAGFSPGDKFVSFTGGEFPKADNGTYWVENPIYNMFEMSSFHMNEKNLPKYVSKIKKIKPLFLHGYPSALFILARYVKDNNTTFPFLNAIIAASENIYPHQRKLIEEAFRKRLFSSYGMNERVIIAAECNANNKYHHVFPQYGITEILDRNGDPVNPGERGELVGTGFFNYFMPFIRYRTKDFATLCKKKCECGRDHITLEDLIGRWNQEMIVGKDGSMISNAALNIHSSVFNKVEKYQYHQRRKGELIIRVEPKEGFTYEDENRIKKEIHKKTGANLKVLLEKVDKIELTERGKFKHLIQELNIE